MGPKIDEMFRKAVMAHPKMAKSHFEIVDPDVWRFDVSGRLSGLGAEWIGPYQFCEEDVDYEAYGLREGICASQKMFLEDLGILVPERNHFGLVKIVETIWACLLVAIAVWVFADAHSQSKGKAKGGQSESQGVESRREVQSVREMFERARSKAKSGQPESQCVESTWEDPSIKEMFEKVNKRNLERTKRGKRIAFAGQPPPAKVGKSPGTGAVGLKQVGQPPPAKVEKSIKERARDAFHKSRWDEAIDLVDQLSEEEADAELRYYIGICYKEGHAVPHNYAEAFYWFETAAAQGNAAAQYELGLAYEKGNGVAVDLGEGIRWYRKAGSLDHADACYRLGKMYEKGIGVKKNMSEAMNWYKKAGALGHEAARSESHRLSNTDPGW